MPISLGGRTAYNPVASSDSNDDDDERHRRGGLPEQSTTLHHGGVTPSNASASSSSSLATGGARQRQDSRQRSQSRTHSVPMETVSKEDTPLNSKALLDANAKDHNNMDDDDDDDTTNNDEDLQAANTNMTVIILDSAQKKFPIPCHSQWTVGKFKKVSSKIHRVAPSQQRLIFRGKMLTNDSQTLDDAKIDTDNVIIHLFPKPRVVVTSNDGNTSSDTSAMEPSATSSNASGTVGGAHIPSIVIDQDEQERRGQILVLGSVEIAESQNNVKMLSLLLLVICSMRLLALFSIAMGVAEEPASGGNDHSNNSTHHNPADGGGGGGGSHNNIPPNEPAMETREWQASDFFDLAVSAIGFYVATLGMKATQENTLRLANAYMVGTIIAGIGWNAWNVFMYIVFYQQETAPSDDDDLPPLTRDDFITVAFFTVAMPLFVWGVCCARAWEFRRLIEEAEEEAAERIRSQLAMSAEDEAEEGESETARTAFTSGRELMDLSATRTEIV
ncbi:ubiquitin family protein [Nitzschia inconspicua]|uniref:Ubiquitin family protein n=1 Tax=Nitzschia inconspicua TaxID=303405 RepID=A0A9K3PMS8_9STRA|nr:ubiquitin family protein [Nitzschia inconspicua]KAG7338463.1 ubiquitin family protein [Nitzschia inconspicua]KAG7350744.1 ubiquitin family protein [Nitzschia inconspicua]